MTGHAIELQADTVIGGRYRIAQLIGQGGMATVYKALHLVTGRAVALKVLRATDKLQPNSLLELFEREFTTLAQVSHPRIVAAHDYGIDPEAGPFYAMELLDGGDLQQRAPVPFREVCSIARDICAALSLLHSRRVLYRDLSPRNVRCTASGVAKLIDFGAMTAMGVAREVVGTPPFLAPEALHEQPLDARTDLYALGTTLYYALTGQHAYPARSMGQLWEVWRTLPPRPASLVADIPEALDRLVLELIQLDPAQRPASAVDVMQRVEAIAGLAPDASLAAAQAYLAAPKLVGRERDQRSVREALRNAKGGRGSAVLVTGPHGSGRSRFLEESTIEAKVHGLLTLHATAGAARAGDYALLKTIATELLHAEPELAVQLALPHRAGLVSVIPELRSRWPELALSELPERERHARVQAAATAWLTELARHKPLCLVVDDSAGRDIPSLALLGRLVSAAATSNMVLIWSASAEERKATDWPMALVLLERASRVLELAPLDTKDTTELLASVFGEVPNLAQLASYVAQTAAGSPRDTLRLLQHLVDERVVIHSAGAWTLPARLSATGLPSSMQQAMGLRIGKLSSTARLLALALAAEPQHRFSVEDCALLLSDTDAVDLFQPLLQTIEAGVVVDSGAGYQLAQLGLIQGLTEQASSEERAAQHRRLAQLFERRGDGLRAAKHLLRAGDRERGLDLLVATSAESQRLTDADMRVYFETMRALPADWLELYEEGVRLCDELERPARQRDALLGRALSFIAGANSARGVDGFALMAARLARLARDVGLDLYTALPEELDVGTRLRTALEQAQQRFLQTPPEQRVFEPVQALQPLTTTLLSTVGTIAVSNDVGAHRQLPSLGPLVALSPALWVTQQTVDGVGARIEGRFEAAAQIYQRLLERLERPDAAGLQPAIQRTTLLRVSLSLGTLEACMGLAVAGERADLIATDPDYETQAMMLRHLHCVWQGQLEQAQSLKHAVEQRRAFSATHNGYESQHLLAELSAQALLEDLTGLRQSTEAARRIAAVHASWSGVAEYCEGEYERSRGDLHAALGCMERALCALGGAGEHQVWPNAAAAHVRVLVELGHHDQAVRFGEAYVQQAEQRGLGYQANYIRIQLSQALCHSDLPRATALAESTLESFRQLGSTGLNLVWALENCASVALAAKDTAAFERYAALSSAANAQLSRRLRRARQWAGSARELLGTDASSSALVAELSSALRSSVDVAEQGRRALLVAARHTDARAGVFYARRGGRLERVSSVGELTHVDALDRWAQAYFEGQVLAQEASTSQLDALSNIGSSHYGVPEGMYLPHLLGHDSSIGYVYTGMLVLMMPVATEMPWMTAFTEMFSRSLAAVGAA